MYEEQVEERKPGNLGRYIVWSVVGFLVVIVLFGSFTIIQAGERGVITRWGEVDRVLPDGLHFKIPVAEKVHTLDVRTQKVEGQQTSASNDLQIVSATIALNYNVRPSRAGELFEEVGIDYDNRIIQPAIAETVKASTAKYNAENLIQERSLVRDDMKLLLVEKLEKYFDITEVSIVDFSFSQEFDNAIEAKVTAEQRALEAKNKLEQIKFEAQQRIEAATAEAEAIRIQAQAITQQGGKDYVNLKAVEKWDGKLPNQFVPGSAIPFLPLGN